ncbi:uncharacterized protein PG998_002766 [Apiospora kogelbergensis]|uniref:uncharacterized protein n=1 Tax=Apiospora kogelbergensis TaxID=1337665 RepID=UPI00312EB12D
MSSAVIYANQPKDFSLWDSHKEVLKDLYLIQKKTLKEVKHVSESAYETTLRDHLGFRKNLKGSDWKAIATHLDKRQGKESVVTFLGDTLAQKRVDKEVNRYRPKMSNANPPIRGKYGLILKKLACRQPFVSQYPPLPASITIRTPPAASPEAVPDLQSTPGDVAITAATAGRLAPSARLITTALYGPPPSSLQLIPPPFAQDDVEALLHGPLGRIRMNLPFNEFTSRLMILLESHGNEIHDSLRSVSYLHQMTGSPMAFGLNSSFGVLLHASYMISNGNNDWNGRNSFLKWFGLVADMQFLRLFFSENTPTATATWYSLGDLEENPSSLCNAVLRTWFEIGLTTRAGKWIEQVPFWTITANLRRMDRRLRKQTWKRISKVDYSKRALGNFDFINDQPKPKPAASLEKLVEDSDVVFLKAWINGNVEIQLPIVDFDTWLRWYKIDRPALWRIRTLLKPGSDAHLEEYDYLRWETTDKLCIPNRMENYVTVSGICAAAGRGLEHLRDYIKDKPHPTDLVKQVLLQIALSGTTEKRLESTVKVLLEYGVDIEVKLLESVKWLPILFNYQEVLDATITRRSELNYPGDFNPIIDCLSQFGLNTQQFGPRTMLKAVGLLSDSSKHSLRQPAVNTIRSLQRHGVKWDDQYFNDRDNLSTERWWNGKEVGGMDLLQAAIRKGCEINTVRYLLDEGMQVHSRPCAMDGKSMIEAAFGITHRNGDICRMLLAEVSDIRADPVWPKLLELSISRPLKICKSDLDLFNYARSIGATLPTPTDRVEASRRFRLIPKLGDSGAHHEVLQEVWNDGAGLEMLQEEDLGLLLGEMIRHGCFSFACAVIEQGANVNWVGEYGSTPLMKACQSSMCPLWFIRYLLERNADIQSQTPYGYTAMHAAAESGNLSLATLLIEKDADVNSTYYAWTDGPKYNPLDSAVDQKRLDMVKLLLDVGGRSALPGRTGTKWSQKDV